MTSSARIVRVAVVAALAACLSQIADAQQRKRHRASPPPSLDVVPSPEIEARVASEVAKARQILADLNTANLLDSPYLVSAVYYHDGFLTGFPVNKPSADPERRIIGQISNLMTPDEKALFVRLLHDLWAETVPPGPPRFLSPVSYSSMSGGRRTHRYAVDLFTPEGSPVHSVCRGLVVLADNEWTAADPFSAASRKGGNAVIVFDPDHDRFYRYCHMSTVSVRSGEPVAAGQTMGTVGHTGFNAARAGHGHHLHFESNEYVDGKVRAIDNRRLRAMLLTWPRATEEQTTMKPAVTTIPVPIITPPPQL